MCATSTSGKSGKAPNFRTARSSSLAWSVTPPTCWSIRNSWPIVSSASPRQLGARMSSPLLTVGLAVGCIRRSPGQSLRLFRKARGSQQRRCGNKLSCSGTHLVTSNSHPFAGQLAGLLHPGGELSFVDLLVFVDVEVAHV